MQTHFQCRTCLAMFPMQTEGGTGYGTDKRGHKHCYACCGKRELASMQRTGKATLYLTSKANVYTVTDWPGSLRFECRVRVGRHNIAGKRYDAWFRVDGQLWHGVQYGDNTQILHCKRTGGDNA